MGVEPSVPGEFHHQESGAASVENPAYKSLLEKREYSLLAHLLEENALASKSEDSPIAASLISAIRQVCQVCLDCQTQKANLRQLQETVVARERALRQTLQTMLILLEKAADGQLDGLSASELGMETAEAASQPGFWQRIQDLLGLVPSTETPQESEAPAIVAPQDPTESGAGDPTPTTRFSCLDPNAYESDKEAKIPATPEVESAVSADAGERQPTLLVYCLGPFQTYLDDRLIEYWPSGKGKAIFKYLVTHRELPSAKEVLMELFWPDVEPDAARNNLNAAIYGLRQALRNGESASFSHVLYQDEAYLLNPELSVWVDVEEFQERYNLARRLEQEGELDAAIREYFAAESLYQFDFLAEDRYEDWILSHRQRLQVTYLNLLERLNRCHFEDEDYPSCIAICHKMLVIDLCREDAHRLLMHCYERQGQRYLALRQYHLCVKYLNEELDVSPTPETIALYEQIRH